jgi:hypothetical protein
MLDRGDRGDTTICFHVETVGTQLFVDRGDTAICCLPAAFYLPACVISSEQERFWGANLAIELSQSPKSTEIRTSREPRRCLTTVI